MTFILFLKAENNQPGRISGRIEVNVCKIRIEGDEDSFLLPADRDDIRIRRTVESLLCDRPGIVACLPEKLCSFCWEILID